MTKTFTYLSFAATLLTITTAANAEFVPTEIVATDTIEGFTEKQYLGYSADFVGNQLLIGAASTAVETPTSNSVYIYNISDNGKALIKQIISAPSEADKKFFGFQMAASESYLAVYSSKVPKVYIYAKQDDGSWTSDSIASINTVKTINGLDVDGDRIAVVENDQVCIEKITKDGDKYIVEREPIADGEKTVESIDLNPMALAIKDNTLAIYVKSQGIYIYEYNAEGKWALQVHVEKSVSANLTQSVAIGDDVIVAALGDNTMHVIEKSGDTWKDTICSTIELSFVTKSYHVAAHGNVIAVADNSGIATTESHYAEFYTKVDGTWTLVKYIRTGDSTTKTGIAWSNAFNGEYYVGTNQLYNQSSGAAFVFNFITDLEYTASEAQSVEENFEEQSPSNVIDIAKEYNATVTYSTSADGEYTEEIPSFEEPGIYTIYYKIEAEGYNTATGSVSFTINEKPSVVTADVETISNDIRVYTIGRNIVVENAEGKSINIYNITGTSVYAATSINSKEVINSSKSGIYIIEVDGTAYKVVVK
ncbi:MAG: T9SS type A sorting domain-containing protein [Bacteroidales bacterium]|nr:T9SS type A sorting domain-containing protein [Bacteroidales bacterium]